MRVLALRRWRGHGWDVRWCQMWYWWQVSVSPWLNVRSQWKGGTANATKSQWQPDPWERERERENTFFLIRSSSCAPPLLPNLHSNFFSRSCFLSCLIHLFLTFGFPPIKTGTSNCFGPCVHYFVPIHTKQEAKSRPFSQFLNPASQINNNNTH